MVFRPLKRDQVYTDKNDSLYGSLYDSSCDSLYDQHAKTNVLKLFFRQQNCNIKRHGRNTGKMRLGGLAGQK